MASSSMDTEAAGHEPKGSDYTVSATAHAVDSGTKHAAAAAGSTS
jgi:hypothetical protein